METSRCRVITLRNQLFAHGRIVSFLGYLQTKF